MLDWTCCHETGENQIHIITWDFLKVCFKVYNWLPLPWLLPWTNQLPPVCYVLAWKPCFKRRLVCKFDIMKSAHWLLLFLAATKQLYEWYFLSVCPSVCPSVRLSHLFDYVPIILSSWNFQELLHWTRVRSMRCPWSRSEVKGQGHRGHDPNFRFRTVTPVWIHIWWWNDTYSLMLLRRGALLFFKVIRQISRSHGAKIAEFDPDWAFPDCNSSLNSPMAMKCCTKLEVA